MGCEILLESGHGVGGYWDIARIHRVQCIFLIVRAAKSVQNELFASSEVPMACVFMKGRTRNRWDGIATTLRSP